MGYSNGFVDRRNVSEFYKHVLESFYSAGKNL